VVAFKKVFFKDGYFQKIRFGPESIILDKTGENIRN
jgi:hypothetical protein